MRQRVNGAAWGKPNSPQGHPTGKVLHSGQQSRGENFNVSGRKGQRFQELRRGGACRKSGVSGNLLLGTTILEP